MQIVSATQFKLLNRNRKRTNADFAVRKQMIAAAEPIPGGTPRALRFTISTGSVDREKDTIAVQGWDLRNFVRNPVVLWGHDASRLPIGRASDVRLEGAALKATVEFIPADTPEGGQFAESVYQLACKGFLGATSVGFRPLKWEFSKEPDRDGDGWFPGIDFEQQELLELSIVTVPANPEALMEPMPAPAIPGEVASDTPPETGEAVTSFDRDNAIYRAIIGAEEKQEKQNARRREYWALELTRAEFELELLTRETAGTDQ
jgi:HK97 family phage prohead protease